MSEKKKKLSNRVSTIPFVLLWTLSYAAGWGATLIIGNIMYYLSPNIFSPYSSSLIFFYILAGGLIGLVAGSIQQIILRVKISISIRNWWLWTTLASACASGILFYVFEYLLPGLARLFNFNYLPLYYTQVGLIFTIPALAQALLLRNHIKRIWLWILAAFVSGTTFMLAVWNMNSYGNLREILTFIFAGLAQGIVMALTLVWLFGMTRVEPLKRGMDAVQMKQAEANLAHDDSDETIDEYSYEERMKLRQ